MIFARADKGLVEKLARASEVLDRPASQIVREAVKKELEVLARKHPELKK